MSCMTCGQWSCVCPKQEPTRDAVDEYLTMKSGTKIPRCAWVTQLRCWLPASGSMPGRPRWCHWHQAWQSLVGDARTLEDRIERPAFEQWWHGRENAYGTHTSWGLSQEEYWRYAHGHKIHDEKPVQLPVPAHDPAFLTRDEFGQDLFQAIQAQAGAVQALKTATLYDEKGLTKRAQEYTDHAKGLQHTLTKLFDKRTIAPADISRILKIQ